MQEERAYMLSKDYDVLHDLVRSGNAIVCFVDYHGYGKPVRDVCKCYEIDGGYISFSVRGTGYAGPVGPHYPQERFSKLCADMNVEFIEPHDAVTIMVLKGMKFNMHPDSSLDFVTRQVANKNIDDKISELKSLMNKTGVAEQDANK